MKVLNVGSGVTMLSQEYLARGYEQTRLDIDPETKPDIVASMTDMGDIGTFDIVWCSHALEHLYPYDVTKALAEFFRVLAPGGRVAIAVPDLEGIPPTEDVLYVSEGGPIAGLDLYYGHRASLQKHPYMAHHTGFISRTLKAAVEGAGFVDVKTDRLSCCNLIAVGKRP